MVIAQVSWDTELLKLVGNLECGLGNGNISVILGMRLYCCSSGLLAYSPLQGGKFSLRRHLQKEGCLLTQTKRLDRHCLSFLI